MTYNPYLVFGFTAFAAVCVVVGISGAFGAWCWKIKVLSDPNLAPLPLALTLNPVPTPCIAPNSDHNPTPNSNSDLDPGVTLTEPGAPVRRGAGEEERHIGGNTFDPSATRLQ